MSAKLLAITALLLSASLGAAELTVDHVSVAGRDLKQMQARLAALGIPSEFGGPHSNHATQMALTGFPDGSYLELIALQDKPDEKAVAAHYWSKQIRGNAGPAAWAVRANDTAAEVKRLRAAGIEVTLQRSGRERPDGTRLEWEASPVGPGPNGVFFPFLIHDFTPREARAFPKGRPATRDFSGVKRVVIAVRDLKASIARYRQAYALPEPMTQEDASFGARLAWFQRHAGGDGASPRTRSPGWRGAFSNSATVRARLCWARRKTARRGEPRIRRRRSRAGSACRFPGSIAQD